ncbi:hypothetical protein [Prochlorothrix hollandica]|uniref:Uncharacterized protein n=1 Tax=Prochlorothrix hollandica PCC 9006 = CALU 1027 TaxID=317619 RepID=A0A0M2Q4B2_PROHO|nr:hypothetical protein [Prochlorothrix hollandica]KKJ01412.1 hypothetical protein PROH_03485 [Prochlorothrix hollandica PCC 9006 = CALU 1027]
MKQSYGSPIQNLPWLWFLGLILAFALLGGWILQGIPMVLKALPLHLYNGFKLYLLLCLVLTLMGVPSISERDSIGGTGIRSILCFGFVTLAAIGLGSLTHALGVPLWGSGVVMAMGALMAVEMTLGQGLKQSTIALILLGVGSGSGVLLGAVALDRLPPSVIVATLALQGLVTLSLWGGAVVWVSWQDAQRRLKASLGLGLGVALGVVSLRWLGQQFGDLLAWAWIYGAAVPLWVWITAVLVTGAGKVLNGYWGERKAFEDNHQVVLMGSVALVGTGLGVWLPTWLGMAGS